MIEMLGVLAIEGGLSVGGIAGYSKAMEKFKLNKQFVNNLVMLSYQVDFSSLPYRPTEVLRSMDLIPDGMKNTGNGIRDVFGNDCHVPFLGKHISLQPINIRLHNA